MKIEIINKPMLCWDNNETQAQEWHVVAKITDSEADEYPFLVVGNETTYLKKIENIGFSAHFKNVKPLPEVTEMTVAEISKALGKKIKIVE